MSRPAAGRITVTDLRVLGQHGVSDTERAAPQPLALDLDFDLDTGPAAASDALSDTVDYGTLCARAADLVASRSFHLLEALATAVADDLLAADRRLGSVTVSVRKLRPPLPLDVGSVGVTVSRARG